MCVYPLSLSLALLSLSLSLSFSLSLHPAFSFSLSLYISLFLCIYIYIYIYICVCVCICVYLLSFSLSLFLYSFSLSRFPTISPPFLSIFLSVCMRVFKRVSLLSHTGSLSLSFSLRPLNLSPSFSLSFHPSPSIILSLLLCVSACV